MTDSMLMGDSQAFGLYALYTSLLEISGVFGGIIADKYIGLRRSIMLGGLTILLGHVCLAIIPNESGFTLGLAAIVVGTGLYRSNIAALLGSFYTKDDPRRESGFTFYYTGINIGGFLAAITCGVVGETYGWHAGFGLAAIGMLTGIVALIVGKDLINVQRPECSANVALIGIASTGLSSIGMKPIVGIVAAILVTSVALMNQQAATAAFPLLVALSSWIIYRSLKGVFKGQDMGKLLIIIALMVVFYGCEEQLGSTLVLFADRHVDKEIFGYMMPASSLIMFNPLTILIAGPIASRLLQKREIQWKAKIAISFVLLSAAYGILYFGCENALNSQMVPLEIAICSIVCIAFGELFIGPTVYAAGADIAPPSMEGMTMAIVTMGFALANLSSGMLSQMMVIDETTNSLAIYSEGFAMIALFTGGVAIMLLAMQILNKKEYTYAAT